MGFLGLSGNKVEALFLAPEFFRRGGGRLLVEHARELKGPLLVDINEQNPQAREFHESLGFVVDGRSEVDSTGRPFPLLHMREIGAEQAHAAMSAVPTPRRRCAGATNSPASHGVGTALIAACACSTLVSHAACHGVFVGLS